MQYGRWLWLCVVAFIVAGCSSVKEELKPVALEPILSEYKFKFVWSSIVGSGQDVRYARLQPVLQDDVIYLVDAKGKVFAVDAKGGDVIWENHLKVNVGGGLAANDSLLFLGTLEGEIIAVNKSDGEVAWRTQVSSEIVSNPSANNEVVVTLAIDGRVFALDIASGEKVWTYDHPVPVLTLRSNASPLIVGDELYIGFDNGQLLKFNASNGQLRWAARVGQPKGKTDIERLIDVDAAPLVIGPYVYSVGYKGRLIAVNRGTGRIAWGQEISSYLDLVGIDSSIVAIDDDSHIKSFDSLTGSLNWESDKMHRRDLSSPVVWQNLILSVDANGVLHGLHKSDGRVALRKTLSDASFAKPIIVDDRIYTYSKDGTLTAYQIVPRDEPTWIGPETSKQRGTLGKLHDRSIYR